MSPRDIPGDTIDDCSTTTSFRDHSIDDGSVLIRRTYYRLADAGVATFDPTEEFADRPEADLRTDMLPTFYQHLAGFHCAYR